MTAEFSADVAVLMPKISDERRFSIRYAGLEAELQRLGAISCFVESHTSFNPEEDSFNNPFDTQRSSLGDVVQPQVVRDLTMSLDAKPLYGMTTLRVVHAPETNHFIADKTNFLAELPELHPKSVVIGEDGLGMAFDMIPASKILIKPATGMLSEGVQVLDKPGDTKLEPGKYIAQEFIDTSGGMPEFNILGVHNLRVISIDSQAIGAIGRVKGDGGAILKNDVYGSFVRPDELPAATRHIVNRVHDVLRGRLGVGKNVIAIDVMRGTGSDGEIREVLCEVNRRPLRISPWDYTGRHDNQDAFGLREMAKRWDKAEADMLAGLVD